ncbi:MAG: hypothetical protein P8J80_05070 [Porticoccaceae bacterium]|nr:hypothetical protein [Porticoccaceae bacterium]
MPDIEGFLGDVEIIGFRVTMTQKSIHIGNQLVQGEHQQVSGEYVDIKGEEFYKIANYNQMKDFFISVVSDSNHWLFISTRGGLSAGRVDAQSALFPYYTDDKISDSSPFTGSRTIALVTSGDKTSLWEPLSDQYAGVYHISRNLYKNVYGDKLIFEEVNHDLGLSYRYAWRTSDRFGFVKTATLVNNSSHSVSVDIVDGIENLIPFGVESDVQNSLSCLVDAYKKNELDADTGLGLYSMSSILVDRAEPSEALSASVAWSVGMPESAKLVSSIQLDAFRKGLGVDQETDVRGRRGAYFVNGCLELAAHAEQSWSIVADVNQGPADVRELAAYINSSADIAKDIEDDIALGSHNLARIVGTSDGLQVTEDRLSANHHFANVLFNVMRGGLFVDNYTVDKADLIRFVKGFNRVEYQNSVAFFEALDDSFHYSDLIAAAELTNNASLQRLCMEYLPLSFSRRHGDPSRPWNKFAIQVKQDDGSQLLNFEGNWRDIFQNWEALSISIPNYVESMISKFVNASTADGYNPYRITRAGIDWEKPEPNDPWASIGYWGDHQIIYLLKFLELSNDYHPGTLKKFLSADLFCYANVPYRIKGYKELLKDPHNTIDFDEQLDALIDQRVAAVGADGRLIWDKNDAVYNVNLTEKLLATVLSKLSNFIPEAGIWMNTQRPEWNDANNALVGYGVSMVTLYYTRRYQQYLLDLFSEVEFDQVEISTELVALLNSINSTFVDNRHLLEGKISDTDRRSILSRLAGAADSFRAGIYNNGFAGERVAVKTAELIAFCQTSLAFIDHSIAANRREDGLYHAYNLMTATDDGIEITYLYEMLEGQVAVLSSGYLSPEESLAVLQALRQSALYTERQNSYLLYPDRELSRFMAKNIIPQADIQRSALLQALVSAGDSSLIESNSQGGYHFNGAFNNVASAQSAMQSLAANGYADLVVQDQALVEEIFESVFNHRQFTGRSGGMYAYEGLGSIYWHMVSKLLLAALESFRKGLEQNTDSVTMGRLADCYFDIRSGIGFNKTPDNYGAFPTDPYSHTPGFAGAKQPGMTGQVKEEVIARLQELGVAVVKGCVTFNPFILRKSEFLSAADTLVYFDINGERQSLALHAGQLGFTYCQVPVVYSLAEQASLEQTFIELSFADGSRQTIAGNSIDSDLSMAIFDKKGTISSIRVTLQPGLE